MADVYGLFESFLESAASLAVLFIIVAWVSSKIVEFGQLAFNMHGKILRRELERCFGEDKKNDPNKGEFTRYFYWHPMIVPLTQPSRIVDFWRKIRGRFAERGWFVRDDPESCYPPGRLPGQIAPESFAAVVINPFPWPTTPEPLRRLLKANLVNPDAVPPDQLQELAAKLIREGRLLTPGETWQQFLVRPGVANTQAFNPEFLDGQVDIHGAAAPASAADRYIEMCASNALIPHPLETRIVTLLRDAEDDMDEFRAGLRRWYAEAMSRVTGRFKRTALIFVFAVALVICALFNLNAINLFGALMNNPELRAAGVAASGVIGTESGGIEALSQKLVFAERYKDCEPKLASPECRRGLLDALWRDSSKFNALSDIFPADPNTQTAAPAPAGEPPNVKQVGKVEGLCKENPGLCSSALRVKLKACLEPDPRPTEACATAWNAIWTSSGFFWHPEAALALARSLSTAEPPGADLKTLLDKAGQQAKAETEAIKDFLGKIPDLGPFWQDDEYEKGWMPAAGVLFGILLSAILAALGAPFWYDVLGKISRRGASGARGDKT